LGIKLIELALDPKVCGGDIPSKEIGRRLRPFVTLLIDKIGEMNYRAKDVSENTFSLITRHPSCDIGHVTSSLVNLHEKPGGVLKQGWRIVVSRIEMLDLLLNENEAFSNFLDWYSVINDLLAPALNHNNVDVRTNAVNLIINFYRFIG
jgi:hypothetical protein